MNPPALRPLRVGELLDAAVKIYKTHARTLIPLAAVVIIPFQAVNALVLLSIVPETADLPNGFGAINHPGPAPDQAAHLGATYAMAFMNLIASLLVTAACVKAVSDAYLDQPISLGSSLRFAGRRLPSLLWLEILTVLGLILGLFALIVGAIYLYYAWAVAIPALLIEGYKGRRALGRSRRLVKGHWWRTFGILALAALIAGVFISIIQAVLLVFIFSTSDALLVGIVLVVAAAAVGGILVQPFTATVNTLLYYDLRVRREGYDVEVLAGQLGLEATAIEGPAYLGPESVGQPGGPPYWPPPPGWTPGGEDPPEPPPAPAPA
jgi:hypothetical protein